MTEVLFRRNTHNPDGTVRSIVFEKEPVLNCVGLGVHGLEPDEFHSFSHFVGAHIQYAYQFPDAPVPSVVDLLRDLATLVAEDLVEVKVKP